MRIKDIIMTVIFAVVLVGASLGCIISPDKTYSYAERRELMQFPDISNEALISGQFSKDFESYTTDQFPLRDGFRAVKSFISYNILGKKDNNGLFYKSGHISKLDTAQNTAMMEHASERINYVRDKYFSKNNVYFSIIPDKNFVLAKPFGYPSLDYEEFISAMRKSVDFNYIDITDLLDIDDFYTTDTHWRQEKITDIAERIANEMGTQLKSDYTENTLDKPFYGVYSGQYAKNTPPDKIKYLTSDIIDSARVLYDDGMKEAQEGDMYNMEKAEGNDAYEMFLSGTMPLITIENKMAETSKELILFRDSYGSSIAPLLLSGYKKITLVDIRYIKSDYLGYFMEFNEEADVLFMYSTTLLNNSLAMQ